MYFCTFLQKKEIVDLSTRGKVSTTLQGKETINTSTNEEVPTSLQENETVSTRTNETVLTTPPKTQIETKIQPTPVQREPEIQPNQVRLTFSLQYRQVHQFYVRFSVLHSQFHCRQQKIVVGSTFGILFWKCLNYIL